MSTRISLPNGLTLEVDGNLSVDQLRDTISALGVANVAGAQAVESTLPSGQRQVAFAEPQGTTKG